MPEVTVPQQTQPEPAQYVDLEVCGVLISKMKVMVSQYKGKCNNTGEWFKPGARIAFKHKDYLNDKQKQAVFGNGTVYHVTVLVPDDVQPRTNQPQNQQIQPVAQAPQVPQKKGFTPSKYQEKILEHLFNSQKHLFIEALAGCGKTSTLVWLVKELQKKGMTRQKAIIYLAFNKSIQEELVSKLQGTGCPALTTHGFCFSRILKKHFKELDNPNVVKGNKANDLFLQILCDDMGLPYSKDAFRSVKKSEQWKCRSVVSGSRGLVGFIKNWAVIPAFVHGGYVFSPAQKEQVTGFLTEYQLAIPEGFEPCQVVDWACRVTAASIPLPGEGLNTISYDDMLYLPLALGLPFPKFDLVLTDESQDFNEAQEQILQKMLVGGGRAVVVGDEHQAIYRFRGADSEAFKRILAALQATPRGAEICELPLNYRSDKAIIEHARQWVPNLEGNSQEQGEVSFDTTFGEALQWVNNDYEHNKEEFAFLCRVNVPLVITAYQLIAQGKKVCIIGRQAIASPMLTIIDDLCGVPDRHGDLLEGGTNRLSDLRDPLTGEVTEEGLMSRLANYYRIQVAKLTEEKLENTLEELTNNVECIEIICTRVQDNTVASVRKEIEDLFTEEVDDKGVIKLSTVHRAKGLEWDTVLILRPDLLPHPLAKPNPDGSWSKDQQNEENLQYVAATRAKHKLHYICNWPFGRGKGVRLTPTVVTPQVAKELLDPAPVENRQPSPTVIRQIAEDIRNHKFVDDGEPF